MINKTENLDKCPNCGKFLNPNEEAFFTREEPDSEMSYMVACCNSICADEYEFKYYQSLELSLRTHIATKEE